MFRFLQDGTHYHLVRRLVCNLVRSYIKILASYPVLGSYILLIRITKFLVRFYCWGHEKVAGDFQIARRVEILC